MPFRSGKPTRSGNLDYLFALVMLVVIGLLFFAYYSPKLGGGSTGQQMPSFEFVALNQQQQTHTMSLDQVPAKVVLVNLWGTWCPPCVQESPHMNAIHQKFRNEEFQMLAISCGSSGRDNLDSIRDKTFRFMAQKNLSMPVCFDPSGEARSTVMSTVGSRGFPTTVILDRERKVRGSWIGYRPGVEKEMEQLIEQLLNE